MKAISKEEFFAKFRVITKIGEGGSGSVFKIIDTEKHYFALKSIMCPDLNQLSASMNEILIVSGLKDSAIVEIDSYLMDKKEIRHRNGQIQEYYILGIIMELAEFSLFEDIRQRRVLKKFYSKEMLYFMAEHLAKLMYRLQAINIAHRDLKPENILLTKQGFKLTDFGLAQNTLRTGRRSKSYAGSPFYVSPLLKHAVETNDFKNLNHDIYKSDVFSFGLILLEAACLCDIRDFNSFSKQAKVSEMLARVTNGGYDVWFVNVLKVMLDFDENKRLDFLQLYDYMEAQKNADKISRNPFSIKIEEIYLQNLKVYVKEADQRFGEKDLVDLNQEEKEKLKIYENFLVKRNNNSSIHEKANYPNENMNFREQNASIYEEILQKTAKKFEKNGENNTEKTKKLIPEYDCPILIQEKKLFSPKEIEITCVPPSYILTSLKVTEGPQDFLITAGESSLDVFLVRDLSTPSKFFVNTLKQRKISMKINVLDRLYDFKEETKNHMYIVAGTSCPKLCFFELKNNGTLEKLNEYNRHHDKSITAITSNATKRILITGSSDFLIRVFEISFEDSSKTFKLNLLHTLTGHYGGITGLHYFQQTEEIISSGTDSSVFLWSLANKKMKMAKILNVDWISCMSVESNQGEMMAFCGTGNKGLKVIKLANMEKDPHYDYLEELFSGWISFVHYYPQWDILLVCESKGKILLLSSNHQKKVFDFEDLESDINSAFLIKNIKDKTGFTLIVTNFDGKIKYVEVKEFQSKE